MKNFLRGLRFASPYWRRLVLSVVCAGLAAVFWSLSFTAAYPVLKILGTDKNLQLWVNDKIKEPAARVEPLQNEVDELKAKREEIESQAGPDHDTVVRRYFEKLSGLQTKLESTTSELYWYHVAKRFIDMLLPTDKFHTLA